MFQPKFRRTFAAFALATLTSLLPLAGLEAMPLRQQRQQPRETQPQAAERFEQRELPVWRFLLSLWEKLGAHIDDNGLKLGAHIDDNG